jgi:hypothetical protein
MDEMESKCNKHENDDKYVQKFNYKTEMTRPVWRYRWRWEDTIKMNAK